MKCFYITNECLFQDNKILISLLTGLSKIKTLFEIRIAKKGELKLSQKDQKEISEILPNTFLKKGKKQSIIHWYNDNYEFKIQKKDSHNSIDNPMDIDE